MEIYLLITVIAALAIIMTGAIGIIGMRNKNEPHAGQPLPNLVDPTPNWDRRMFYWLIIIGLCFLVFSGLTAWFVLYNVNTTQHMWCHILNTINASAAHPNPHAPPPGSYGKALIQDFSELARSFGC